MNYYGVLFYKEYLELSGLAMISGANKKQDWKWEEWWERNPG